MLDTSLGTLFRKLMRCSTGSVEGGDDQGVSRPRRLYLLLNDSRTSDRATVANSYHELMTTDLRPELGRIMVPTTILYVRPAAVPITEAQMDALYRNYYANLKGASLVRVPDAAHFLQIDAPARFGRELRGFLAAK